MTGGTYRLVAALVLLLAAGPATAGSLTTRFTTLNVKDIPVGHWTEVALPGGERYSVTNDSDRDITLALRPSKPFGKRGRSRRHTPIPDVGWVTVEPERLELGPHESGQARIAIRVPDDPAYAGRRYEVWIVAKSVGGQFAVGLATRIRFNTVDAPAPVPLEPAEE